MRSFIVRTSVLVVCAATHAAAEAVKIDADHLAAASEHRQHWSEHVDRTEAAMQQQQRLALPVNLVVVVHAVGFDVALLDRSGLGRDCGGLRARVGLRLAINGCENERLSFPLIQRRTRKVGIDTVGKWRSYS